MSRPRPSHAGFCPKAGYAGLDRGLAPALAEYFVARRRGARPATVGDFGAGRGWYSAYLNKVEGLAAAPYDYGARPGTAVRPFDISRPLNGTVPVFDAVLCLEVGEHVPARFEDVIFDNIATHAHDAVVLSWAAPGQPGLGHVNTLPEARVVAQMAARGWARDERASARLRAAASFPHFRAHVLAFSRAPWPPEPRGKPRGCPAPASPHSVVVLARVLYEQPFLAGFVDWYAARGVECVLLVRDGLDDAGDVAALPPVAVQRAGSRGVHADAIIQATLADVRATGYAWMLVVDADEYLALHPRFDRSLPRFIEMQAARVPHLAAIQFSWAAAEALGAACPARAPFDAFFANAHVKTLARVDRVDRWNNPHAPVLRLREADCPGLPRECPVVLSGGRAVAATRGRRRGSAAEYGLPFFTATPPARDRLHLARVPGRVRAGAGARPGGRVQRRRARARPRPEHDERARQGVRSRAGPDAAAPDRGERHRAPGRGSRARAARPGEVRAGRGPQGTPDAGRARLPPRNRGVAAVHRRRARARRPRPPRLGPRRVDLLRRGARARHRRGRRRALPGHRRGRRAAPRRGRCGGRARGHATTSADSDGGEGEDGILAELTRTRTPNLNIVVVSW